MFMQKILLTSKKMAEDVVMLPSSTNGVVCFSSDQLPVGQTSTTDHWLSGNFPLHSLTFEHSHRNRGEKIKI